MAEPEAPPSEQGIRPSPAKTRSKVLITDGREVFTSVRAHIKDDRVSVAAGSFAYRWFLSLFPIIIALLGVTALLDVPRHVTVTLINGVTKALPAGAADVLTSAIKHSEGRSNGAITAIVIAGAVALWSATSGMVMVDGPFLYREATARPPASARGGRPRRWSIRPHRLRPSHWRLAEGSAPLRRGSLLGGLDGGTLDHRACARGSTAVGALFRGAESASA
jgi:hypothetical protein